MNSKYKSKEFVLTLYISTLILVLLYSLASMAIEWFNLSNQNLTDSNSIEEIDYIKFVMFYIFCVMLYELFMLGWSLILLKEYNVKERSKITFYLVLVNSSLPLLYILYVYLDL